MKEMMKCRICDNQSGNKEHIVREMMFGTKEEFLYFECANCGCLQIADIPENMGKYYPLNYTPFGTLESSSFIKQVLKQKRNEYAVFHKGILGRLIYSLYIKVPFNIDIIRDLNITRDSKILDLGCGNGVALLYPLNQIGCRNLLGVDPFIKGDVKDGAVKIRKIFITDLPEDEKFDVIVFNHSFEHIPNEKKVLEKTRKLLSPNGVCLVRIPLKSEYIWGRYGVFSVQLDAPRHFFIHTIKSMEILAGKAGLKIKEVRFDSTEFQFWGSEQCLRGIAYTAENSYLKNPKKSIFTKKDIKKFRRMAKELNRQKQGDSAAFYLVKA